MASPTQWVFRVSQKATANVNFAQGRLACAAMNPAATSVLKTMSEARRAAVEALSSSQPLDAVLAAVNAYLSHLVALMGVKDTAPSAPPPAAPGAPPGAPAPPPGPIDVMQLGRAQTAVNFSWRDCVSGVTGTFGTLTDEFHCILLAFAIWCYRRSSSLPFGSSGDDPATKEAYHCLRRAAGVFTFVLEARRRAVKHDPGTDFDDRIIESFGLQALAEAGEITLERARQKGNAVDLIASIAADVAKKFTDAEALIAQLNEKTLPGYHKYLAFKKAFYNAYANLYRGLHLFAQEQCGAALKAYTLSQESLAQASKAGVLYSTAVRCPVTVTQHVVFTTTETALRKAYDKANHENGFIYHQRIPAELTDPFEPKCLVQAEPFQPPGPAAEWAQIAFDASKIPARGKNAAADIAANDAPQMPPAPKVRDEQFCIIS